jgi:methyl-accepting chemotaxis protein
MDTCICCTRIFQLRHRAFILEKVMFQAAKKTIIFAMLFLAFVGVGDGVAFAQRLNRVSDRQVNQLLRRIEQDSEAFRRSVDRALDRSRLDGSRREDEINQYLKDFANATERLRDRFRDRRDVSADVENVLSRARIINSALIRRQFGGDVEARWRVLRSDLRTLARLYNANFF